MNFHANLHNSFDVWTKEVFANYFAARIVEPLYPSIDHRLSRLKSYTIASLSEDRTTGSNAIRQELDNLRNAGLIYGNIIYNKAPVMMSKLVEIMGEEPFREGIHQYLTTFAYGNATWNDLVAILDKHSEEDIATFSEAWVEKARMPFIHLVCRKGRDSVPPLLFDYFFSMISIPPRYFLRTSGTTMEPSARWFCSTMAGKIREVARPEPFRV